jgi:hypothetical protein
VKINYDFFFQCLVDDDRTIRLAAFQALECVLKLCKVKRKRALVPTGELSVHRPAENGHDRPGDMAEACGQGSILQNSISAENFSDKFTTANYRQISTEKNYLVIVHNNLGLWDILKPLKVIGNYNLAFDRFKLCP